LKLLDIDFEIKEKDTEVSEADGTVKLLPNISFFMSRDKINREDHNILSGASGVNISLGDIDYLAFLLVKCLDVNNIQSKIIVNLNGTESIPIDGFAYIKLDKLTVSSLTVDGNGVKDVDVIFIMGG